MPRNTDGLRPDAASKGALRQSSIQLPPDLWDYLDMLVGRAIADSRCVFTGRIGRGDVIGGLALGGRLSAEGFNVPVELLACGIHWDEDGDCVLCGGTGIRKPKDAVIDCPLCDGEG